MHRIMNKAAVAAAILSGAGGALASDRAGINDYAKVQLSNHASCVPFVRKYQSVCGGEYAGDAGSGYDLRAKTSSCQQLAPGSGPTVEKGQIIAIYLNQLLISDFLERGEIFGRKRGEIAVVARIAEQDATTDFDFSSAGVNRGRVVYFSTGVQPGQTLNFSQMPIYGPVEYKGKPLLLEFHVLELDIKERTELSGLLTAVANLGQTAYPPASPILKVLEQVGGGLLATNKNDVQFKYHATLLPREGQAASPRMALLEYGNYAFVRMPPDNEVEDGASSSHRWNKWWFNQKNGRVYSGSETSSTCSKPVNDRTFLTLQIVKANAEATLDSANTFAKLSERLTEESKASLNEKIAIVDDLKKEVTLDKNYRDAKKLIDYAIAKRWPSGLLAEEVALDALTQKAVNDLATLVETSIALNTTPVAGKVAPFSEFHTQSLVQGFGRLAFKSYVVKTFSAGDLKNSIATLTSASVAAKANAVPAPLPTGAPASAGVPVPAVTPVPVPEPVQKSS